MAIKQSISCLIFNKSCNPLPPGLLYRQMRLMMQPPMNPSRLRVLNSMG
jgi:hypothetical protein